MIGAISYQAYVFHSIYQITCWEHLSEHVHSYGLSVSGANVGANRPTRSPCGHVNPVFTDSPDEWAHLHRHICVSLVPPRF